MKQQERLLQENCLRWFRLQYPDLQPLLFAVPNGGSRNATEAANLKKQGVTSGVSDLILLKANKEHSALCIEMKVGKNKQTDKQKAWQKAVTENGNKYVVCRSFEEFEREINQYLKRK